MSTPFVNSKSVEGIALDTLPALLQIPPKLFPLITQFNDYSVFLLDGGRGSAKSQTVARLLLFLGEKRKLRICCGREFQANIEESVYTLLKDLITAHNLAYDVFAHKIKHKWSGSEFTFKGFREQGNVNVKGLEGIDILWIDEAQSISEATLKVIVPTIRKLNARMFFTMNRFLRDDAVYMKYAGDPRCLHITINYFDNPFCPLSLKVEAENCRNKSERDYNYIWMGQPLKQADMHLFDFDKLHASLKTQPWGDIYVRQRIMAVDFAAQGNDQCVASIIDRVSNQHWKLMERIPWDEPNTMVSVGKIVDFVGRFKPTTSIIDIGGMGKPVFDRLSELKQNFFAFDGGSTQGVDTNHYSNCRSAAYFKTKEWFDDGFIILEEKDKEVIRQAEQMMMIYSSDGVRSIEPKVKMKKRLGFSPDDLDSLMMGVWAATNYIGQDPNQLTQANGGNIQRVNTTKRHR